MIRALIAEDSATTRELLISILTSDPEIQLVGVATNGAHAVTLTRELRPDVVVMDIRMPEMDGFEATRNIMIDAPTPIVIVSAVVDTRDVEVSMQALEAGAVAAMPKPSGPGSQAFRDDVRTFLETIKSMSQVKVVRRFPPRWRPALPSLPERVGPRPEVLAVAASTGGPAALKALLGPLPRDLPVPVLVVQHIARGFVPGFVSWLDGCVVLRVEVATQGAALTPGTVYVAPDSRHLCVAEGPRVQLSGAEPDGGFRPSANALFKSVARVFGRTAVAMILTGMGHDGLEGLRAVRSGGGRILAQDRESCVVFGMPAVAIAEGLADATLTPPGMARRFLDYLK